MRAMLFRIIFTGIMLLLSSGCDSDSQTNNTPAAAPGAEQKTGPVQVSPAVEGSRPALPDKEADMALVAKETKQNEAEEASTRKDRDADRQRFE